MSSRGTSGAGTLALTACCLVLSLTACTSKKEKHDRAVEAAWEACQQGAFKTDGLEDDVVALEQFLAAFPEDDPLANAHAPEARSLLDSSRKELASRAAERVGLAEREQRVGKARPALAALVGKVLFSLASSVQPQNHYDDPAPLAVVSLEHEGFRLLSRGRFALPLWETSRWYLRDNPDVLEQVRKNLGADFYGPITKELDHQALQDLLDAAYVAPDAPLLGRTALEVYPIFRPFVRAQARLHRMVDAERDRIKAFETTFNDRRTNLLVRAAESAQPGGDGQERAFEADYALIMTDMPGQLFGDEGSPPFGNSGTDHVTSWGDRRLFYRAVTVELNLDRKAGIRRPEFSCLDTGFWLRRLEDGSAAMLAGLLDRVLRDYDPGFKRELDAMGGSWPEPKPPAFAADPGEGPAPAPRAPRYQGPLEGDRLVSLGLESDVLAAAFDADGAVLSLVTYAGLDRYSRVDAKSVLHKPLRAGGRAPQMAVFSRDASRFAVTFGASPRSSPVQVFLTQTGELVDSFELPCVGVAWPSPALGLNEDGTRLAVVVQGKSNHEIAVRQVGGAGPVDAGAESDAGAALAQSDAGSAGSAPRNFQGTLLGLSSSPTSTSLLMAASGGKLVLVDVDTGAVRGSQALEGVTPATGASPDCSKIVVPTLEAITVMHLDVATAKFSVGSRFEPMEYVDAFILANTDRAFLRAQSDGRTRMAGLADGGLEPGFVGGRPLAVSPDGTLLVTQAPERELLFYSLARPAVDAGTP